MAKEIDKRRKGDSTQPTGKPENMRPELNRTFSVAPMMDWTTRDYRAFARTLTRHAPVSYTHLTLPTKRIV